MAPDSRRRLARALLRGALTFLVSAALAAPLAAIWGLGRTEITDYLGPNRTKIAVDYTGETRIDLGPLGNAYLPMSYGPIGMSITVDGIESGEGGDGAEGDSLLSKQTLQSYLNLYKEPREAMSGIAQRLQHDAVRRAIPAEIVLVLVMIGWTQRKRFLSPRLAAMSRSQHAVLAYLVVLTVTSAVVVAPTHTRPAPARYPVTAAEGTRFAGLTVDSPVLDDLIDRGTKGLQTLASRQDQAVKKYVHQVKHGLKKDADKLAKPASNEQRLFGFSDLHCNIAMTKIWKWLVKKTDPDLAFSTGDDTDNGTAAERFCITQESEMVGDRPFVDAPGNHDSNSTTGDQQRAAGTKVLDGKITEVDDIRFLGDADPEHNPPFSIERVHERSETEAEMGNRMIKTAAGGNVDVIMMHQPRATAPVIDEKNPPSKLVAWGHLHDEKGPKVIHHEDGSWTVAMQMGTAGGKANPTITSFSTPFSTPRKSADAYFYFRDRKTGLITGVQPVHAAPDGSVDIQDRIDTGDLTELPDETRKRLDGQATPSPQESQSSGSQEPPEPGTTSEPGKTSSAGKSSVPTPGGSR